MSTAFRFAAPALLLVAQLAAAQRVEIQLDARRPKQATTGAFYVFFARDSAREPRLQGGSYGGSVPFFGIDVDALTPRRGRDDRCKARSAIHTKACRQMPAGQYYVQALMNVYTKFNRADGHMIWVHNDQWEGQHFNTSPGNLVSAVQRVHVRSRPRIDDQARADEGTAAASTIPADTRWVKRIKIKSELLSKFWGRRCTSARRCCCQRDSTQEPTRRYPAIYSQGHFGLGAPFGFTEQADNAAAAAAAGRGTRRDQRVGDPSRRRRARAG